jgi:DNA replication protein DnaC
MILEQTVEKLSAMKLKGMVEALEQWRRTGMKDLEPADLIGLLADAEWIARENRCLTRRLQEAHFPVAATIEEIDYQHHRGLQKSRVVDLSSSRWVAAHQNIIITGPTGIGKTYLPCALGNKACRDGYRVLYTRIPRIFGDLYKARVDGTYPRFLQKLAKVQVLIIDDLGSCPLEPAERRDLREILEDRYSVSSTIITSQLDPKLWHSFINDQTVADGVCDRVIHNAHRFKLEGESLRKKFGMNPPSKDGAPPK